MENEQGRVAEPPGWLEPEGSSTSSLLEIENMPARKFSLDPLKRLQYLLSHSVRVGQCREWQGRRTLKGYGLVSDGRDKLVHRVMWEVYYGEEIPPDINVCHSCDNPPCCEVTHLFLGTQQDNLIDARDKGRTSRGIDRWKAVLTEEEVKAIKTILVNYPYPVRPPRGFLTRIAEMYRVHPSAIHAIWTGENWSHINGS